MKSIGNINGAYGRRGVSPRLRFIFEAEVRIESGRIGEEKN
jgi:hypothetical protein